MDEKTTVTGSDSGISTETTGGLLKRWQHLQLQRRATDFDPAQKADVLRNLLAQIDYTRAVNILSHPAASSLWLDHAQSYSATVDSPDEGVGLNNYAEGAMSLLEGKRNESQQWRSGLSMQLSCVDKFVNTCLKAQQTVVSVDRENTPLEFIPYGKLPNNTPGPEIGISVSVKPHAADRIQPLKTLPQNTNSVAASPQAAASAPGPVNTTSWNMKGPVDPERMRAKQQTDRGSSFWKLGQHGTDDSRRLDGRQTVSGVDSTYGGNQVSGHRNFSKNPSSTLFSDSSVYNRRRPEAQKRPREPSVEENETERAEPVPRPGNFRTAREQLARDSQKKYGRGGGRSGGAYGGHQGYGRDRGYEGDRGYGGDREYGGDCGYGGGGGMERGGYGTYGTNKKSLGTRRGVGSKFVPPVTNREDSGGDDGGTLVRKAGVNSANSPPDEPVDERLKNIEPKMIELIMSEVMDHGPSLTWNDIAGLEFAKKTIKEIVVWPMLRPDIFTGLRGPPKGLLLFGPPGTGKTLIGKCIASQSKSTFFSISASSLTSKWVGEGEKMVRALFAVARVHQPAVIFIDEIDSLLSQRSDGEHEASRRIKTEFLVQLDGATTGEDDRILVVGATNRPQEIDEAARRRFVKRLYIPLPETKARRQIVVNLMSQQRHQLSESELALICDKTKGYSGADMANLCREAALGPIRSMSFGEIEHVTADQVRPIVFRDFEAALPQVRASVSEKDLDVYLDWNKQYGSWDIVAL